MEIESYSFGKMVIDGKKYKNDLIIFPERIKDNWWRDRGHFLQVQDLEEVFKEKPEVLIIGKGAYGRMDVSQEVKKRCREEGIELKAEKTGKATEVYNRLKDKKEVVAALHLTC